MFLRGQAEPWQDKREKERGQTQGRLHLCGLMKLTTILVYRAGKPSKDRIRARENPAKAI
jgi:hypothetical protein